MARHRRTKIEAPRGASAPTEIVRSVTIMLDLNRDRSVTAIIGVMNLSSRRYVFHRMPLRTWWGSPEKAFPEALLTVAQDALLDYELLDALR